MILGVKDKWHPYINGDKAPEIRSDDPKLGGCEQFVSWVKQHGGSLEDIYIIEDDTNDEKNENKLDLIADVSVDCNGYNIILKNSNGEELEFECRDFNDEYDPKKCLKFLWGV